MVDIVFPELSYKIIGAAYRAFDQLGWGMLEKYYQRALAEELKLLGIKFVKEFPIEISYSQSGSIGRYFADFLVGENTLVELETRPRLGYVHLRQVLEYLRRAHLKLAILIYFTKEGVRYRRVLNSQA